MAQRAPIPSGGRCKSFAKSGKRADQHGLQEPVMKNQRIRFDEVRSEGKLSCPCYVVGQ